MPSSIPRQGEKKTDARLTSESTNFDMRLVPLLDVRLGDLEVDAFDVPACALDLDSTEVIFKVREKTLRLLHQSLQADVVGHVLGKIDQEHGHVEADVLGRMVKSFGEFHHVDLAVLIRVHAHQNVIDVLTEGRRFSLGPVDMNGSVTCCRSSVLPWHDGIPSAR